MNLLFTAHSYPPDVSGVAAVVGAVAEGFASRGHSVHVATGTQWFADRLTAFDRVFVVSQSGGG